MNLRVRHLTLLLALLGTAAYAADVYKSTAPDGTVIYSDRPEGADAQFIYSATPSAPRTQPGVAQAGRAASGAQAASPPQTPAIPTLSAGPTSAQLKAERQKNCEIAKETQQRYTLSRRLFRTNAVGEREYLDDAAVAEARAKAAADVKDWCD
ncbi:MAG TPA: DUF4124 domain-containing protein [Gammaproteobacteria bacterium]|nr:DUF4124 domain-containing protein [Gammaproteobacteria bacterium]